MSHLLKFFGVWFLGLFLGLAVLVAGFPNVISLRFHHPHCSMLMLLRPGSVRYSWVPYREISPYLKSAVVQAEDGNFYRHRGIDLKEVEKSFQKNVKKKSYARGSSTITMQLAKNLYLFPQKTILRKFLEVLLALKIETEISKERILELYLNVIEWGPGIYGAEEASRYYFKKSAAKLTPPEAAFLASIIPNPRKWGHWPPGPYVKKRMKRLMSWGLAPLPQQDLPEEEDSDEQ